MNNSQPLDPKLFGDIDLEKWSEAMNNRPIKKQYMGHMFRDDLDKKYPITDEIKWWFGRNVKERYYDIKWAIKNMFKWFKTISYLRSWDGQHGVLLLAQKHLQDYLDTELKYGHSEESFKQVKINSVTECLEIIKRFQEDNYTSNRVDEVKKRYPEYVHMVTEYDNSTSYSGDFIQQDSLGGWVGIEAGNDPRQGYFTLVDNKFELTDSPDPELTKKLLNEVIQYNQEISAAYAHGHEDFENDKKRIGELLNKHFFSFWD